jgi:hypothetical protein
MDGGAPGPGPLPHRVAALFDPQPQHRGEGSARLPEVWDGRAGLEPAGEGHAHRPLPQAPGTAGSLRAKVFPKQMSDERNLEAVERLIPIAEQAGLSLTHMAMAFLMVHPSVTSAILGPRTMQHLDDLLAGAEVVLDDEILDRIDEVVAPGTDAGPMGAVYLPPAVTQASLHRRPLPDRAAA